MCSKIKKIEQKRKSYNTSFKEQAVALGKEIGMKEATEKLGLSEQALGVWTRASCKRNTEITVDELSALKEEIKKTLSILSFFFLIRPVKMDIFVISFCLWLLNQR